MCETGDELIVEYWSDGENRTILVTDRASSLVKKYREPRKYRRALNMLERLIEE